MEAIKALPEGGDLRLLYFLPKFARDRLYTYPLKPKVGEHAFDCHWTTFNFCNDTPDDRFTNADYVAQILQDKYYQIDAPTVYGDLLLVMDDGDRLWHSAVYLADDLVFTKNGDNYRAPWMLMHIDDLLTTYSWIQKPRVVYLRTKGD
jgi:hypothetical protein